MQYEDPDPATGTRYGYRLGIEDAGEEVFAGEAWVTADAPVFALEGVRPNPAVGGRVSVQLVLPAAAPAKLELFDVNGRRVSEVEVGALGPGRHVVDLSGRERIPPGIYLVRFTQGQNHATAMVVSLR